ncbi:hypothetical protein DY000_02007859 [Brassica cretica]|uniref:Uncharacterized protein n=1 Tax=Brassica cretica TaxID=69181 RepID=A0ABQ7CM33_BRACR|nr:hypothetical protein DY000_02007859 [Brassica cretica]
MTPMRLRLHRGSILFLGSYLELSGRIGTRRFYTHDPKSYGELWVSSLARGLAYGPGVPWEPEIFVFVGTVLRLPRQDYYRYLFGFRILPLGSWPLSSSYDVFYLCKKSLIGLEGASVGVMTQVLGFAAFHVWRNRGPQCALGCTGVLGSFDSILRLAIGGLWRPDPARMPL